MSGVSMEQIKALREETGAGVMDVKKALTDSNGDMNKAREILRQKGVATAEKKSNRVAAEGTVQAHIAKEGKCGALVEVNCETDFAAKNQRFLEMVAAVAMQAAEKAPATLEALLEQPSIKDPALQVKTLVTDTIGAVKENMTVRRFVRYDVGSEPGLVHAYIHAGGKIGVLVDVRVQNAETVSKEAFRQAVKDVAMHVAASAPEYVVRSEIPASVVENETRIEMGKEDLQSKPEAVRAKIVEGRVNKIMEQRVLLEQPFIKDPNLTIEALLADKSKELGDTISIKRFTRYLLGEGVDRTQAEEEALTPVGASS